MGNSDISIFPRILEYDRLGRSRIMTGRMVRVDIVWDNLSNKQYLKETKALKVIWKHKKHMDNLKEYKVKTTTYKNIE